MKHSLTTRKLRIVKNALRSALIMSAVSLLAACGGEAPELAPEGRIKASKSLSPAQTAQCSHGAALAAGWYHTVGLKEDGTVMAVGSNDYGQLNVSPWTDITAVAAGRYHTVGLKENGTVTAVGQNGYDQLNVSPWTNIQAIAAGTYHTVGLKEDGTVVAVGYNSYGQLNLTPWTKIKAIAAGWYHTVGLNEDGTVVTAGHNGFGQRNVSPWTKVKAVAAGWYHTVGLNEDGTVVAVGYNGYGQLNISPWTNVKAIAAGTYHTVGLKEDGTVVAVGHNGYGQLNVSTWTNIKSIAAGGYHTVGLKEDGTVVAVGQNGYGQLEVSPLFVDIMPLCTDQNVTPPITAVTITGTPGNNGWYVSDVQMTLTATTSDCSGVKEIHYIVDGTEAVVQGCSAVFSIVEDGVHGVLLYAIDNAGHMERPQELSVTIDKTPPSVPALSSDPSILWPPNHKMTAVMIGGSAVDGGSGIDSTLIAVTDEYGIYDTTVPGFGSEIELESWREGADRDGRFYTITAVATDKAGNQATATTTVLVPHDMR